MARRTANVFGLSFLDVMFCGFGAVILLVMILNSNAIEQRRQVNQELKSQVDRLENTRLEGQKRLVQLKNSFKETEQELVTTKGLSKKIISMIKQKNVELSKLDKETLARIEHINRLKADLKSLDEGSKRLEAGSKDRDEGDKVRRYLGQGQRQYLTGLKVGGKRILILVDSSASMLNKTIVNIIRLRNLSVKERIRAKKWRQTIATVDWLTSQIPPTSKFQMYAFNASTKPIIAGTKGKWLAASGGTRLNEAMRKLKQIAPEKGTNLFKAFASVKAIKPLPDNVILLTDGLPTIGRTGASGSKVSGEKRLSYFLEAIKQLPSKVPVNIILFPIEGDPYAASSYWKLAVQTKGSLLSPSKDWP